MADAEDRTCELFVGNLVKEGEGGEHSEDNLRSFFEQFGLVTACDVKRDNRGLSKGFAFVKFADPDSIDAVIKNYEHNLINGVWLDCKRSVDRTQRDPPKGSGKKGGGKGGDRGGSKGGGDRGGSKGGDRGGQDMRYSDRRSGRDDHHSRTSNYGPPANSRGPPPAPAPHHPPARPMNVHHHAPQHQAPPQQQGGGQMLAAALLHPSVCPPGMVPGWVPVGDPNAMTFEELGLAPPRPAAPAPPMHHHPPGAPPLMARGRPY